MYFEQFYLGCLAHASYMFGSRGVCAVVDPQRDIEIYLKTAAERGLKITHIFETHLHADFVSGHRELAERTGADIYIGEDAGAKFPHVAVHDGDEINVGECRVRVLHTPGHTPESVCLAIYPEGKTEPWGVLTGDTLFIGDVGRPDLSPRHTPQELAGLLYDSLHKKLLTLADDTLVYPAHGAGSLCGRNMRAERHSTIGTERLTNAALLISSRERFIEEVTSHLPCRPDYFLEDANINRSGAGRLDQLPEPPAFDHEQWSKLRRQGVFLLDTRPGAQYAEAHVPGSVCISLVGQFATWAGSVIGLHTPVGLVAESRERMLEARMRLARVGIENVVGWLGGGVEAWQAAGHLTAKLEQIDVAELYKFLENGWARVLDVRREAEWQAGHIAGARWYSLDQFPTQLPSLQDDEPWAIHCKGGYRSIIAAGLLMRAGMRNVVDVKGGYDAWAGAKLPVVAEQAVAR